MARLAVEDRRRELVDAAIKVIARAGVAAATTRAIVAEADMSLASFHYAFASRDELIEAVIAEVTEQDRITAQDGFLALAPALEPTSRPPSMESVVLAGLEAYLELLIADPLREQALLELTLYGLRTSGFDEVVRTQYRAYLVAASAIVETAAVVTHCRWELPVADVARILLTFTDGLTTTWLADRDTAAARATVRFAARSVARLAEPLTPPTERSARLGVRAPAPTQRTAPERSETRS